MTRLGVPTGPTQAPIQPGAYVDEVATRANYGSPPLGSRIAPATLIAPNAAAPLTVTTYASAGGNTIDVVEPSVYYNQNGWNGYEFWMAACPYPQSNSAYENPSIWVSHDGLTWITPPGGNAPAIAAPGSGNYDDPHLFELHGTMYLVWNWSHTTQNVMLSTSTDGITWSTPTSILTTNGSVVIASPALAYYSGSWYLWTLDTVATNPRPIVLRKASTIAGLASATPTACTLSLPTGKDNWEFEVKRVGSEWWMLHNLVNTGGTAAGGVLYLRTSTDGLTWSLPSRPILMASSAGTAATWDGTYIYKSTFLPLLDGRVAIWYNAAGNNWRIGFTIADKPKSAPLRSGGWYAPQCGLTTVLPSQGAIYYCPVWFAEETTLSNIGLEVTVVGSAGSVIRLGIYEDARPGWSESPGRPGLLLLDAGTIDGTTTNSGAPQTLAAAVTVGPGVVWFAACGQGSPATRPTVRATNGPTPIPIGTTATLASQNGLSGYFHNAGAAGALPTLAAGPTGGLSGQNAAARIIYQVA